MLNVDLVKNLLIIAMVVSTITVIFIQKTKRFLPSSKIIPLYGLFINIICGYLFCNTFANNVTTIESIWVGLFSFLGADTIYITLDGKLAAYSQITDNKDNDITGVIPYE